MSIRIVVATNILLTLKCFTMDEKFEEFRVLIKTDRWWTDRDVHFIYSNSYRLEICLHFTNFYKPALQKGHNTS